jgi:ribosomal protein RSM22 (predicted rRNA methylase)
VTRRIVELPRDLAATLPTGGSMTQLTKRYRDGAGSERGHLIRSDAELRAYATARFPATYAAATAVLDEVRTTPTTHLDVGSGLGATAAAAHRQWPGARQTCLENDPRAVGVGRTIVDADWITADLTRRLPDGHWDLVTAGYVLTELADPLQAARDLWRRAETLVLIEPGSRRGCQTLMAIRNDLTDAHTVAPCPHQQACPLGDDWCHLGQRLPRSAAHRQAKSATQSYEDEPFSYLVLARTAVAQPQSRVIRRPEHRKGHDVLTLCTPDAQIRRETVTRSDPRHRAAREVLWGQTFASAVQAVADTEPATADEQSTSEVT